MITAIIGPVFELIAVTSYLDLCYLYEYYELDYACDFSSFSDVAGLAIASCSFLIGRSEQFILKLYKPLLKYLLRSFYSVSGIFGLILLVLTSKRICCKGKFLQIKIVIDS